MSFVRRFSTSGTTTRAPTPAKMSVFKPAGTPRVVVLAAMPVTFVVALLVPLTRNAATRSPVRSFAAFCHRMTPTPPVITTGVLLVVGAEPSVVKKTLVLELVTVTVVPSGK